MEGTVHACNEITSVRRRNDRRTCTPDPSSRNKHDSPWHNVLDRVWLVVQHQLCDGFLAVHRLALIPEFRRSRYVLTWDLNLHRAAVLLRTAAYQAAVC